MWFADLKANSTLLKRGVRGWVQRLNSISEITAVKPVKGRDTEMYPIGFNHIKSCCIHQIDNGEWERTTPNVATTRKSQGL